MAWNDIFPVFGDEDIEAFKCESTTQEKEELETLFGVEKVIGERPEKNILSVSLFWKHVSTVHGEVPEPSKDLMMNADREGLVTRFHPWKHYVEPILNFEKFAECAKQHYDFSDYKLRVYLAKDLEFLADEIAEVAEVYLMKSSSIHFAPGGLWRFLAFDDAPGVVTVIDVDQLGTMAFHVEAGERMREHDLGFWRFINVGEPDPNEKAEVMRYLPAWGCGFGADGRLMDFSWKETMKAFVWHSWKERFPTTANHPIHGPLPVYGSKWPDYGYDEWFIIAAAYPRLAHLGVLTYVSVVDRSICFAFDIEYVTWANPKSMLVYQPLGAVRLRELTPEERTPERLERAASFQRELST